MTSGPFSVFPAAFLLEEQLQAELDVARAARAEHGIIALHIRRRTGATELARGTRIQSRIVRGGNCDVGGSGETKAMPCTASCVAPIFAMVPQLEPATIFEGSAGNLSWPKDELLAGRMNSPDPHPPRRHSVS